MNHTWRRPFFVSSDFGLNFSSGCIVIQYAWIENFFICGWTYKQFLPRGIPLDGDKLRPRNFHQVWHRNIPEVRIISDYSPINNSLIFITYDSFLFFLLESIWFSKIRKIPPRGKSKRVTCDAKQTVYTVWFRWGAKEVSTYHKLKLMDLGLNWYRLIYWSWGAFSR